jgi:hypothetical protein
MFLDEIFSGSSERHCTAESKSSAAIDENVVIGMAEMAFSFENGFRLSAEFFLQLLLNSRRNHSVDIAAKAGSFLDNGGAGKNPAKSSH